MTDNVRRIHEARARTPRPLPLHVALRGAHRAYRRGIGAPLESDLIDEVLAIVKALSESIAQGMFLTMDVSERDEAKREFVDAINSWRRHAYATPPVASVSPIREGMMSGAPRSGDAAPAPADERRIPVAVAVEFTLSETVSVSVGRPAWRSEAEHSRVLRKMACDNLLHGIEPIFDTDIENLRTARRMRVLNCLDYHAWEQVDLAFDHALGGPVRTGPYTDGMPYGRIIAELAEQTVFEAVASALEGDTERFQGIAPLARLARKGVVLGPVASVSAVGTWAVFHRPKSGTK